MIVLGLTGSIGMGKSTTAALFAEESALVWDADAAVHDLYAWGGAAVAAVEAAFPGVSGPDGVNRARLAAALGADPDGYARLEAIVHPLVREHRADLMAEARAAGARLLVLDIPLLMETGGDAEVDAVVVVTAPAEVQRERVLSRPGMTPERFAEILARQTPDTDKRARADFIIETHKGLDHARDQVRAVVDEVLKPGWAGRRGIPSGAETPQ
ncbi:dephospho-CoA kinase [Brevundimonas sp.]|uniref:dephospho-CoA kinase n=1 Tax=Brevundimonas sp. TaxID=1871086 RepID=UPI001E0E3717|nr:dephospho-CoA kinase [Brevundimonas sp.]MBA4001655.1 dephospho-CoA kinase [Brevundimonas sp.]